MTEQPPTQDVHLGTTLEPDAEEDQDLSRRERLAARLERRLDLPMAVLAVGWALFLGYELVAPAVQRPTLTLIGNVVWGIFIVEFVVKLAVSGRPLRFVVRRWPSVLFLALPALRMLRIVRALRTVRLLPAARVIGSSYRTIGTAQKLLQGRLAVLGAITLVVIVSGGQLLYLLEGGRVEGLDSLGDALWWSANLAMSSTLVVEPETLPGRMLQLVTSAYSVVVFASLAATLGAYFTEARQERATAEDTGLAT